METQRERTGLDPRSTKALNCFSFNLSYIKKDCQILLRTKSLLKNL